MKASIIPLCIAAFISMLAACSRQRAIASGPVGPCPDLDHLGAHGLELAIHEFPERSQSEVLQLSDVVAGGPGFVAVGTRLKHEGRALERSGEVWFSGDGRSWEQATRGGVLDGAELRALAVADGVYVVAGSVEENGAQRQALWLSPDGRSWRRVAEATLSAGELVDIASGGGRFVAVGASLVGGGGSAPRVGAIWVTPDGTSWSSAHSQVAPDDVRFDFVEHTSLGFVSGGALKEAPSEPERAVIWMSTNGDHWWPSPHSFPRGSLLAAVGETRAGLVAVGGVYPFDGPGINPQSTWTSADGLSWAVSSPRLGDAQLNGWSAIAVVGEFVALFGTSGILDSVHGTIWLSVDGGANWHASEDPDSLQKHPTAIRVAAKCPSVVGVGAFNNKFAIQSDNGSIAFAASLSASE